MKDEVKGACELLGFDPLYLANEGKIVLIVPDCYASRVCEALKEFPVGREAAVVGRITDQYPGKVILRTQLGTGTFWICFQGKCFLEFVKLLKNDMKYIEEFRDQNVARSLLLRIGQAANPNREYHLMEFCGGHTYALFRYGLTDLLPSNIKMVHGRAVPSVSFPSDDWMGQLNWQNAKV